jgi:hypothetical protein
MVLAVPLSDQLQYLGPTDGSLVADFDSDGRTDIATALQSSRTVGLMFANRQPLNRACWSMM